MQEKLGQFCAAVEQIHKVQCGWQISSPALLDELHEAVKRRLVPLYQEFFEKHKGSSLAAKGSGKGVRNPSMLNELISQLFEGRT